MEDDTVEPAESRPEPDNRQEEEDAEWMREGDAALKHYQETGLHLTGAEVDEWLAKIEAGEIVELPPCHT